MLQSSVNQFMQSVASLESLPCLLLVYSMLIFVADDPFFIVLKYNISILFSSDHLSNCPPFYRAHTNFIGSSASN